MLTQSQIDAGTSRLTASKLTPVDVNKLATVCRMFLGDLEQKYGYFDIDSRFAALDDADAATGSIAAQVAACIIKMEELGFGVAEFQGGRDAFDYKEKSDYFQYVVIAFSKIYPIPLEWSTYDLTRALIARSIKRTSVSVQSRRSECIDW